MSNSPMVLYAHTLYLYNSSQLLSLRPQRIHLPADKVALFTTQILYSDKKSNIETARDPRGAGGLYSNVYDFAPIMSAVHGIMSPLIGGQEERQTNDGPVPGDDVRNFPNDSCILYILRSWRLVPPTLVKHLY